jgi:hypothetical protein
MQFFLEFGSSKKSRYKEFLAAVVVEVDYMRFQIPYVDPGCIECWSLYRVARPVSVTGTRDNFEQKSHRILYRDFLSFVQAGGLAYEPVKGKMFSTAASGLELYYNEGALKKVMASGT